MVGGGIRVEILCSGGVCSRDMRAYQQTITTHQRFQNRRKVSIALTRKISAEGAIPVCVPQNGGPEQNACCISVGTLSELKKQAGSCASAPKRVEIRRVDLTVGTEGGLTASSSLITVPDSLTGG